MNVFYDMEAFEGNYGQQTSRQCLFLNFKS